VRQFGLLTLLWLLPALVLLRPTMAAAQDNYDVAIYGGTSGGVAAAVQVRRMGKSVVLIEPGRHVGGLTSGGLGATDIGNKAAIGGISREFYRRIKNYYADPAVWRQQRPDEYRSPRQAANDDAMWTFEPHVAEKILRQMLDEAGVPVLLEQRLKRPDGVTRQGARIRSIQLESGRRITAACFIDATYEGDLMAAAAVSYHVGREANSVYDETLNGVQTRNAIHHQMMPGVDPYRRSGDPASGLLPGVHAGPPGEEGSGDRRVQAYNLRMCVTDADDNRIPFQKPEGYDEQDFELLLRNFEAGETRIPWSPTMMPNRKTDTNNNYGFSTDYIGMSYDWADADAATRERIFQQHLRYQRGLMWTLANHPRVPEAIRREVSRWGMCRDEFPEYDGWPHQLYVREARRMVSDYVMTQHHCQGHVTAEQPVGLAAYTMDSHNVQRYVAADGFARNEGDVQVGGFPPYAVDYRSLRPRREECTNLLVPVCLSASHIAYGSIRMEPVFMVLGQSAATAACQSLDQAVAVQDIDYAALRRRLEDDGQVLVWSGPALPAGYSLDPKQLSGIVIDDVEAELSPGWSASRSVAGFVGHRYLHEADQAKGERTAVFRAKLPAAGRYDVRLAYTANPNRATNVPVTIQHGETSTTRHINQRNKPKLESAFVSLGEFDFPSAEARVSVSNADTDGHVIVDAVQFLPVQ
jgi:hypothetical protein